MLGHQVRLEQVLLNLLNNGRDAIRDRLRREGSGGHAEGCIAITCDGGVGEPRMRIIVRDNGTGVEQAVGEHIFEPFVTTKNGGAGLGLGLSISRGICTDMGGSLSYRNVADGAEFVIELPAFTPSPAEAGQTGHRLSPDEGAPPRAKRTRSTNAGCCWWTTKPCPS
ncbi:MAG: ATP-binding protein [Magnetospirillum sp.]|nr:ATP-binding protein [Magnetospirillum sp.]